MQRARIYYILIYIGDGKGGAARPRGWRDSVRHLVWIDRDITKINRRDGTYTERLTYLYILATVYISNAEMGEERLMSHAYARARENLFASPANVNIQALPLGGRNIISFMSMTHTVEISASIWFIRPGSEISAGNVNYVHAYYLNDTTIIKCA